MEDAVDAHISRAVEYEDLVSNANLSAVPGCDVE